MTDVKKMATAAGVKKKAKMVKSKPKRKTGTKKYDITKNELYLPGDEVDEENSDDDLMNWADEEDDETAKTGEEEQTYVNTYYEVVKDGVIHRVKGNFPELSEDKVKASILEDSRWQQRKDAREARFSKILKKHSRDHELIDDPIIDMTDAASLAAMNEDKGLKTAFIECAYGNWEPGARKNTMRKVKDDDGKKMSAPEMPDKPCSEQCTQCMRRLAWDAKAKAAFTPGGQLVVDHGRRTTSDM